MTLEEYRLECAWSLSQMARVANVDYSTLKKAIDGEKVSANTAKKLAQAISKELNQNIRPNQISGLKFS